jgi:hypothetical protein
MNCCNDFGQCVGGKNCPTGVDDVPASQQTTEQLLGYKPAKPARVGNTRRRTFPTPGAPSHWPKTLMAQALVPAATFVVALAIGFVWGRLS